MRVEYSVKSMCLRVTFSAYEYLNTSTFKDYTLGNEHSGFITPESEQHHRILSCLVPSFSIFKRSLKLLQQSSSHFLRLSDTFAFSQPWGDPPHARLIAREMNDFSGLLS